MEDFKKLFLKLIQTTKFYADTFTETSIDLKIQEPSLRSRDLVPGWPQDEEFEDIRNRLEHSPEKLFRQLLQQTGLSQVLCDSVIKKKIICFRFAKITFF